MLFPRSRCPHCAQTIAWYDNIPVISWLIVRGHCRTCKKPISLLYPFIELLTAILITALSVSVPAHYFFGYFLFFSALIVTIRSDLETMLISRFVTLFLIPVGIVLSALQRLPITLAESIIGAFFGYIFLYSMGKIFFIFTRKEGLGQGDIELLAFIGSFIGILGCWISLLVGSIIGSIVGIVYIICTKANRSLKIPFGPFLALGAIFYIFTQEWLITRMYLLVH